MSNDIVDELTLINASLEERVKELECQLQSAKATNAQLSEDTKMQENIISRLQERNKELEGRVKSQIDAAKEINEYKDTIIRLEDAAKEQHENKIAYAALREKLAEREEVITIQDTSLTKLRSENQMLYDVIVSLRQENGKSKLRIADLTGNNSALNAKIDDLQKQLHVASTILYCSKCGENTSRIEDECVGCIMRERLKKCGDSERSVDVEQKLNMPLDADSRQE